MRVRRLAWLWIVAWSLCGLCSAQAPDLNTLLARVVAPKLSSAERAALAQAILDCGKPGEQALAKLSQRECQLAHKSALELQERYLGAFEKTAKKLVDARQTRAAQAELAEQRAIVRRLQVKEDLSKSDIQNQADPALAAIRVIVEVDAQQVLEAQPALANKRQEWLDQAAHYDEWYAWSERAAPSPPARLMAVAPERERQLAADEAWLCLLALPMSAGDRRVLLDNRALESRLDKEEALGIVELNRLRLWLGLGALLIDEKLCSAAREHSEDMRKLGFFAHESPVPGKRTPGDRAARAGTSGGAENIANGQSSGARANRAWWYSPGHHKNLLGAHSRVGLGRSLSLWTQMFG